MRRLLLVLGVALAAASLGGLLSEDAHAAAPQTTALGVTRAAAAAPSVSLKAAPAAKTGSWLRLSGMVRHARARATTVVIFEKAGKGWVRLANAELTARHRFTVKVRFSKAGAHHLRARYRAGGHTARSASLVVHVRAADPLLGDSNTFFGNLLGKVVDGLISGASGEIGGDAMGQILSLLGWGEDTRQNAEALAAMDTKLDQIQQSLDAINTEVQNLASELRTDTDKLLLAIDDPGGAITDIDTRTNDLNGIIDDGAKQPGGGDPGNILRFADSIEYGYPAIEVDVTAIHDAIVPTSSVRTPVLDSLTDLALDKGLDLDDAYLGLEDYFTRLVYSQMRGVDLVVEAKLAGAAAGQPLGMSASTYVERFRTSQLAPEVQSFKDNVWRLVLSKADLDHTATFLPPQAESILSRAEFLSIQILDQDHFGLRVHVVVTDDFAGKTGSYSASGSGKTYLPQSTTTSTVGGPTYDWWSGNAVTPSSTYTILDVDFGDVPRGTYTVKDGAGTAVATVTVQEYGTDYSTPPSTSDPSVDTVDYGDGIASTRTGAVEAFAGNATAGVWYHPGYWSVTFSGSTGAGYIRVEGNAKDSYFAGEMEADYTFIFAGKQPAIVNIPVDAHCLAYAFCEFGGPRAWVRYGVGVWDGTASKDADVWQTGQQTTNWGGVSIDTTISHTFSFLAQPGHQYSVGYTAEADTNLPDDKTQAWMEVHCGDGLEVEFP